jgi:metal transporter CNNM
MILIQDLLLNDPADKVPLRAVIEYYKHTALKCKLEDSLSEMFDVFRKGSSHMAFVYANSFNLNKQQQEEEAVGIITFEDLIEELVQSEIMDESDTKRKRRRKRANLSLSTENLNMFVTDDKTNRPIISTQIRNALFYFLASSVRPFTAQFICPKILETFLKKPEFTIEKRNLVESGNESDHYLYKYGLPCDYFIIILDGKATLQIGRKNELERIEINAGIFSYYGVDALLYEHETDPFKSLIDNERKQYEPDFSLKVNNYCVYLKISRPDWKSAVRKSLLEKTYYITDYIINK